MRKEQKIIHLFKERSIHSIKQVVSIGDEEDLNQLWEYILTVHTGDTSETYAFFLNLYELASRFVETSSAVFFEIIIE